MTPRPWQDKRLWFAQGFTLIFLAFLAVRWAGEPPETLPQAQTRNSSASSSRTPFPDRNPGPGPGDGNAPLTPLTKTGLPRVPRNPRAAPAQSDDASYQPEGYRTTCVRNEASYQRWELDPRELAWLLSHQRAILTSDLGTRPVPGGGLRILGIREGSFAALRGFRIGDLLVDINGQQLSDAFDLEDLVSDPAYSGTRGWRVTLERERRALTLDYRSDSGPLSSGREH